MVDQRLSEGENFNFFNYPALTTTLPAQIALKYNYQIIPIYISRDKNDSFQMEIQEPILIESFNKDDNKKNLITKKLNQIIEEMIKRDPSQWILSHNRWK